MENLEKIEGIETNHRALTRGSDKLIKAAEEEIAKSKELVAASQVAVRLSRQLSEKMKKTNLSLTYLPAH